MNIDALKDHRVLVAGLGISGLSVVNYLVDNGIDFDVADECDPTSAESKKQYLAEKASSGVCPSFFSTFETDCFNRYDVVVLSPGIPRSHPVIAEAVANGVNVIGDIELFAGEVNAPVIAVTGSNGKSTVVSWLTSALNQAGVNAVACGNIGQPALEALQTEADLYVLELSSYQIESTLSLAPAVGVVLNISDDHLDRYDNIDHYAATKRVLLGMCDRVVVNFDDKRTWPTDAEVAGCEFFSLSTAMNKDVRWHRTMCDEATYLCDGERLLLDQMELSVPGEHNVANALAVIALAAALCVPFEKIHSGLVSYKGLPHRSQYVGELNGVRWYNDSKGTNVDACKKAILAMPGPVLLIAGGISKGADFSPLSETLERCVKLLILIGRDRQAMADQLTGACEIVLADNLVEAVDIACNHAQPGDAVLLSPACSSFDMFKNFEDRGEQFVAAVEQVLAA
jgi:UDP-N-acetylmuramoylalanine--D-glutamate ligase